MVKGYAVAKDQYVQVEDEELSEIAIDSVVVLPKKR